MLFRNQLLFDAAYRPGIPLTDKMKQLLTTLILITLVVSPVFGGVMSVEAVGKNAIVVNYEISGHENKAKVECTLKDEVGDIVGIGMAKLSGTVSKVVIGISSDDMGKILDIQCQEKKGLSP